MASLIGEFTNKAMWLHPKINGFNPSERWGHSSCFSDSLLYVYGGCCRGVHLRDIIVLNLHTMCWSSLVTQGKGPGARDSHSAVLWGKKMVVFGGTNGSNKVNDLHILDIESNEWSEPICKGNPPLPRESHTATLVGNDSLVVFGGSGRGLGNYLNDLYVLDLKSMTWSSPAVKGDVPSPRDSHTCVAVGYKLFLFGGDSGDRYHGQVYVFDVETLTWTRLELAMNGCSPGARAGHAALSIGTKIYVNGGVGDNKYYNDTWCLDTDTCVWSKLDICGQEPQGRFSHTAIVADTNIVIYGGCGEDERPLRELLILQNVSLCNSFRRNGLKTKLLGVGIEVDMNEREEKIIPKKRKISTNSKTLDLEYEPEEHSLSLSQNSSLSQSDQEQTPVIKLPTSTTTRAFPFTQAHRQINLPMSEERSPQSLIGADVQGRVDGSFDSGYLMTAVVNGRVFRGVLFAPVSSIMYRRGNVHPNGSSTNSSSCEMGPNRGSSCRPYTMQPLTSSALDDRRTGDRMVHPSSIQNDLHGVALTLGGPTSAGSGRST